MRVKDLIFIGIGLMVLMQALVAFGAIALLTRMTPAIERIMADNFYSNAAAEQALMSLASPGKAVERRNALSAALGRARHDKMKSQEAPVLDAIEQQLDAAIAGDEASVRKVLGAISRLWEINRTSMRRVDEEAKRIGNAGAWSVAILGIVAFVIGVLILRRLKRNVITPIEEINRVLHAMKMGDAGRLFFLSGTASDFKEMEKLFNELWSADTRVAPRTSAALDRAALLHLMDMTAAPTALLTRQCAIAATNRTAEQLFNSAEGQRERALLQQTEDLTTPPPGWSAVDLSEQGWLCMRQGTASP